MGTVAVVVADVAAEVVDVQLGVLLLMVVVVQRMVVAEKNGLINHFIEHLL